MSLSCERKTTFLWHDRLLAEGEVCTQHATRQLARTLCEAETDASTNAAVADGSAARTETLAPAGFSLSGPPRSAPRLKAAPQKN